MKRLPRLLITGLALTVLSVGTAASIVGDTTAASTKNCGVSTPIPDRDDLRRDDRGTCVTVAQGLLATAGTFNATITQYYGPITEAAVRKAQRNAGIPETGVIDQRTWYMLADKSRATRQSTATNYETRNCDNTNYRTICVIKGNNGSAGKLYALERGVVKETFDIRTSDSRNPVGDKWNQTSEGRLKVTDKVKGADNTFHLFYDDYDNSTDASNGKQSIRYSPVFAKCGYDGNLLPNGNCTNDFRGATNGGVDIGVRSEAEWLWNWSNFGTEIVILHSPDSTQ